MEEARQTLSPPRDAWRGSTKQPTVVKATVKSALLVGPERMVDRKMLLTHSNFLTVRKGATGTFYLRQQINNANEDRDGEPTSLPPFESDIIAFSSAQRGKISSHRRGCGEPGGTTGGGNRNA
jgi:hypothetical protein